MSVTTEAPALTREQVDQLNQEAWDARYSNPAKTLKLATEARNLARELDYTYGLALATRYLGGANALLSNFEASLRSLNEALDMFETIGDKQAILAVKANLGATYQKMGQYDVALEYQLEILPLSHEMGLQEVEANTLSNIAEIYTNTRQFIQALDFAQRAIEIREANNDRVGIAYCLSATGNIYSGMDRYEKALKYYERALSYAREMDETASIAYSLRGMGLVLRKMNKLQQALDKYEEALTYFRKINDPQLIAENEVAMSKAHIDAGNLERARELVQEAMQLSENIEDRSTIAHAYDVKGRLAAAEGDFKAALDYHRRFTEMRVKTMEQANRQSLNYLQARFNYENAEKEKEIYKLKNIRLEEALKEVQEKAQLIEQQNADIQGSMAYARQVQQSILHTEQELKQHFPDSYLIHYIRDFVSGDFFWVGETQGWKILAIGDCTGTGIPAGLMSIIGHYHLNEIILEGGEVTPANILAQLHQVLRKTLHQDQPRGAESADSIEIGLLAINTTATELHFAGGYSSLYILKRGVLEEIRGDKYAVGGPQQEVFRIYTDHRVVLQGNEQFFIVTDGYPNQLGGEKGKRMTTKRLRQTLEDQSALDFDEQADSLRARFDEWRGGNPMTDDMMLFSFRL